jgi:hypothetical protein
VETPAAIQVDDADYCIATWDRTLIIIFRRETPESAATKVCSAGRALLAKHGAGASVLFIVEAASAIPGSGARSEFARFTRETAAKVACCVVVPEGGGFRSALVRSIVVGLAALLRQSFPYRFVDDLDSAIRLLGPHLSPTSGGHEALRAAMIDLRARLARAK